MFGRICKLNFSKKISNTEITHEIFEKSERIRKIIFCKAILSIRLGNVTHLILVNLYAQSIIPSYLEDNGNFPLITYHEAKGN